MLETLSLDVSHLSWIGGSDKGDRSLHGARIQHELNNIPESIGSFTSVFQLHSTRFELTQKPAAPVEQVYFDGICRYCVEEDDDGGGGRKTIDISTSIHQNIWVNKIFEPQKPQILPRFRSSFS